MKTPSGIIFSILALTVGIAIGWVVKPANEGAAQSGDSGARPGASPTTARTQGASDKKSSAAPKSQLAGIGDFLDGDGVLRGGSVADAVDAVMRESDPLKQQTMFAELLGQMTAENGAEIISKVDAMVGNDPGRNYMSMLMNHAFGKLDGAAAVGLAQEKGARDGRAMATAAAISGWATTDPEGAKEWIASLEAGEGGGGMEKYAYMGGLVAGLARSDPDAAMEYIQTMEGPQRGQYFKMVTGEKIKGGLSEAGSWADGIADADLKKSAFDQIAHDFSVKRPEESARWIEQHADEEYAKSALHEVADEWAEVDPKAALDWVMGLEGDAKGGAVSSVLAEWAETDPTAATTYLVELDTNDPTRDHAIVGVNKQLRKEDPAAAATWATSIQNPEMREEAMIDAGQSWYRKSPDDAGAWLENSGLSPEAVEKVVSPPKREFDMEGLRGMFQGGGRGGFGR